MLSIISIRGGLLQEPVGCRCNSSWMALVTAAIGRSEGMGTYSEMTAACIVSLRILIYNLISQITKDKSNFADGRNISIVVKGA